jgi:hypothetical protein
MFQDMLDRWECHANASVIGDATVVILGDIEIDSHQHCFVSHIDIGQALLRHGSPLV